MLHLSLAPGAALAAGKALQKKRKAEAPAPKKVVVQEASKATAAKLPASALSDTQQEPSKGLGGFRSQAWKDPATGRWRVDFKVGWPSGARGVASKDFDPAALPPILSAPGVVGYQWIQKGTATTQNWLVGYSAQGAPLTANRADTLLGISSSGGGLGRHRPQNYTVGVGGFQPPMEVVLTEEAWRELPRFWDVTQPPVGFTYTRATFGQNRNADILLAFDLNGNIIGATDRESLYKRNKPSKWKRLYDDTLGRTIDFVANDPVGGLLDGLGLGFVDDAIESVVGRFGLSTTDLFALGVLGGVMVGPALGVGVFGVGAGAAGVGTGSALLAVASSGTQRAATKLAENAAGRAGLPPGTASKVLPVMGPILQKGLEVYQGNPTVSSDDLAGILAKAAEKSVKDPTTLAFAGYDIAGSKLESAKAQAAADFAKIDFNALAKEIKQIGAYATKQRVEQVRTMGPSQILDELRVAADAGLPPIAALDAMNAMRSGMSAIDARTLEKIQVTQETVDLLEGRITRAQVLRDRLDRAPVQTGRIDEVKRYRDAGFKAPPSVCAADQNRVDLTTEGGTFAPYASNPSFLVPKTVTSWKCITKPSALDVTRGVDLARTATGLTLPSQQPEPTPAQVAVVRSPKSTLAQLPPVPVAAAAQSDAQIEATRRQTQATNATFKASPTVQQARLDASPSAASGGRGALIAAGVALVGLGVVLSRRRR